MDRDDNHPGVAGFFLDAWRAVGGAMPGPYITSTSTQFLFENIQVIHDWMKSEAGSPY